MRTPQILLRPTVQDEIAKANRQRLCEIFIRLTGLGLIAFLLSIEKVQEVMSLNDHIEERLLHRGSSISISTRRLQVFVPGVVRWGHCAIKEVFTTSIVSRSRFHSASMHFHHVVLVFAVYRCTQSLLKRTDIRLSGLPGFNLFNSGHFAPAGPLPDTSGWRFPGCGPSRGWPWGQFDGFWSRRGCRTGGYRLSA
jgi:hypothetical protein